MLDCPLDQYLDKYGISVANFADDAGISLRTAYGVLKGTARHARADTLLKVQAATGGEVSVAAMAEWLAARPLNQQENNGAEKKVRRPWRARRTA